MTTTTLPVCPGCQEECSIVTADNGIGAYEYWGAPGFDSQPFPASNCCEVDMSAWLNTHGDDNEPDYEAMRDDRDAHYDMDYDIGEPPF